jgi:hypothetical protein
MMRSRDVLARACFLRGRQASLAETDEFVEQVQELRARVGELEAALRRVTQERDHFKALIDGVVAARKAHEEALARLAAVRKRNAERFRAWQIEDAERAERPPGELLQ